MFSWLGSRHDPWQRWTGRCTRVILTNPVGHSGPASSAEAQSSPRCPVTQKIGEVWTLDVRLNTQPLKPLCWALSCTQKGAHASPVLVSRSGGALWAHNVSPTPVMGNMLSFHYRAPLGLIAATGLAVPTAHLVDSGVYFGQGSAAPSGPLKHSVKCNETANSL